MGKNRSSQDGRIQLVKWNISIDDETKENRDKIFRHCFEWYAEQLKGELGWNYPPLSTPNVTRNNIPAKQRYNGSIRIKVDASAFDRQRQ